MLNQRLPEIGRLRPARANGIDFGRSQFSRRFLLQQLNQFLIGHEQIREKEAERNIWESCLMSLPRAGSRRALIQTIFQCLASTVHQKFDGTFTAM